MYGDLFFRFSAQEEANAYANGGGNVYVLHFDMEKVVDTLDWTVSCCGVPHASELIYINFLIDPNSVYTRTWEVPLATYIMDQYSSIINTGKFSVYLPKVYNILFKGHHEMTGRNIPATMLSSLFYEIRMRPIWP